jgi:hypothetical protein
VDSAFRSGRHHIIADQAGSVGSVDLSVRQDILAGLVGSEADSDEGISST